MENELIETEKKIYENYKKLSYSFSLLSCYFQQLSSPKPKKAIQFEKLFKSIPKIKIDNNINFTISKRKIEKKNESPKINYIEQRLVLKEKEKENKDSNNFDEDFILNKEIDDIKSKNNINDKINNFDNEYSFLGKKRENNESHLKIFFEKEIKSIEGQNKIIYIIRIIFKELNIIFGPYDDEIFCSNLIEILKTCFKNVEFSEFDFNYCLQNIKKKIDKKHPPISI